jgi:serine/threonine protein kinase
MPPEQCDPIANKGRIGPPADVWGLGATLFHAAAGVRPFPREEGDRDSEDLHVRFPQLVHPPIDMPARLPDDLTELIEEMVAARPEGRPTAAEVAARLEPLIAELPSKMTLSRRGSQVI